MGLASVTRAQWVRPVEWGLRLQALFQVLLSWSHRDAPNYSHADTEPLIDDPRAECREHTTALDASVSSCETTHEIISIITIKQQTNNNKAGMRPGCYWKCNCSRKWVHTGGRPFSHHVHHFTAVSMWDTDVSSSILLTCQPLFSCGWREALLWKCSLQIH